MSTNNNENFYVIYVIDRSGPPRILFIQDSVFEKYSKILEAYYDNDSREFIACHEHDRVGIEKIFQKMPRSNVLHTSLIYNIPLSYFERVMSVSEEEAQEMINFHHVVLGNLSFKSVNVFTLSVNDKRVISCTLAQKDNQHFQRGMTIVPGYEKLFQHVTCFMNFETGIIDNQARFTVNMYEELKRLKERNLISIAKSDNNNIDNFQLSFCDKVVNVVYVFLRGELFLRFERDAYYQ